MRLLSRDAAAQTCENNRILTQNSEKKCQNREIGAARGSDRRLVCAEPCVSCRTCRTCVNSSGSSKAASGQRSWIKWADSTAHEPQARRSVHSRVCLLARISVRAYGLMEYTEQVIHHHLPSSRCKMQVTLGSANARKWTTEAVKTSLLSPPSSLL